MCRQRHLRDSSGIFWPSVLSGILAFALVLAVTWPGALRELSLDDVQHFSVYPKANAGLNLWSILKLRHWQDRPDASGVWRPIPKLLWRECGPYADERSASLAVLTAVLAGICVGLFAGCLGGSGRSPWMMAAALVPVLNPLAADVLLPFVGQADLLAAIGVLATWLCWRQAGARANGTGFFLAGCLTLMFAFMSKESSYPAVLALPAVVLLGRGSCRARRKLAVRALLASLLLLFLRFAVQWAMVGELPGWMQKAVVVTVPGERTISRFEIIGRYAAAILAPTVPQTDYTFLKQPDSSASLYPLAGVATIVGFLAITLWAARRLPASPRNARDLRGRREIAAALIWVAVFLFPYLQLVPIATWGARFAFLSLFGAVWCLATFCRLLRRPLSFVPAAYLSVLLLTGIVGVHQRAADWVSPSRLWAAEVERNPNHSFAWKNYATYLQREGKLEAAYSAVRHATTLWPTFGEAWLAQGQIARAVHRDAEAGLAFQRAEQLMPDSGDVQIELALFDASRKRFEVAAVRLRALLRKAPDNAVAARLLDRVQLDMSAANARVTSGTQVPIPVH